MDTRSSPVKIEPAHEINIEKIAWNLKFHSFSVGKIRIFPNFLELFCSETRDEKEPPSECVYTASATRRVPPTRAMRPIWPHYNTVQHFCYASMACNVHTMTHAQSLSQTSFQFAESFAKLGKLLRASLGRLLNAFREVGKGGWVIKEAQYISSD